MDLKRIVTTVAGTGFLAGALVMTAGSDTPSPEVGAERAPRRVELAAVEDAAASRSIRLAGVTRAVERAQLSFSIPARLATRGVEIGDRVRASQLLASLDGREYRLAEQAAAASLAELEVRLEQARREEVRTRTLAALEAATAEELEQRIAAVSALAAAADAAAARLAETRRLIAESTLEAPFAGTVTAVHLEPGEWVAPGRPVVELAGNGAVEVSVEVPESSWARIAVGQPVSVDLPFVGLELEGRITSIASVSMGPGGLFPTEVQIEPRPGLAAGLAAVVVLPLAAESALTVPLKAVLNPGSSSPSVFRIVDGRAERVAVRPGQLLGDRIVVEGTLAAGDRVAVAGHTALADGDAVEVF